MMARQVAIAVDLGGSFIKAGAVDANARILHELRIETGHQEGVEAVLWRIDTVVQSLLRELNLDRDGITGIGVGCPGLTDTRTGIVRFAPNLKGWTNVELGAHLARKFSVGVAVENDANAAAWGEYWAGAAKGVSSIVLLTLGTGIGGGIILNGEIWHGFTDTAAEIGHMVIQADGEPCACGGRGCLEAYASVTALRRRARQATDAGEQSSLAPYLQEQELTGEQIYTEALAGDPLATRLMHDVGYYLGVACVNIMHVLNPEKILLAGGLSAASEMIMRPLMETVQRRALPVPLGKASIDFASLGDKAGLIGVAGCVFHRFATSA